MRDEDLAAGVDALDQLLVRGIGSLPPEANEREETRRAELPPRLAFDPSLEERGEADAVADHLLDALAAVAPKHRPELQRAEAPAELRAVLGEAHHLVGRAQIFGNEAQRGPKLLRPARPQRRAALRR